MNRSKDIGTRGETAVVRAAEARGLVAARQALAGAADVGDVHLSHGQVVIEVKAGKQADSASLGLIADWWRETETEAARVAACDLAVLVVKRRGCGVARVGDWRAFVRVDEYVWTVRGINVDSARVVELPFGQLLNDLVPDDGNALVIV